MAEYHITRKAVQDLTAIWEYTLNTWSESQADIYYQWYETQANRLSNRKYSDVEWDEKHPLTYSYSWYWVLAHPSLIYSWWLLF